MNFLNVAPYVVEFDLLNAYSSYKGHPLRDSEKHQRLKKKMLKFIQTGLKQDAKLCTDLGIKRKKLNTQAIISHLKTLFKVYADYNNILDLREKNKTKIDTEKGYPQYFNRHYHFQTDGYTSEHSASIYDHQVDILFAGMTPPMRRTILEEFRDFKPKTVLELACGTGSGSEIISSYLSESKILATDLSHEYIQFANKKHELSNVDFKQMDAENISGKFDCILHFFLLHELPSKVRAKVLKNQLDHLNPGGKGIIVESLQIGDIPFLDEVLADFPKYFHEPFYKHYVDHSIEKELQDLGAKNIKVTKRLFSKVVSFS